MKKELLWPYQIITLRDYPLYNEQILKIYFRIFSMNQGEILPPAPVVHKSIGIPYLKSNDEKAVRYNEMLSEYLERNPKAEYFLLDGGHKTTAATLTHKPIPVFVVEDNQDIRDAEEMIKKGELFGWYLKAGTLEDELKQLAEHHFGTSKFLTVEDKTKLMVKNRDIPEYMISAYKSENRV